MASLDIIYPIDTSYSEAIIKKSLTNILALNDININVIILCQKIEDVVKFNIKSTSKVHLIIKKFINVYQGFNSGLNQSTAEYVAFLKPGDYVNSSYILLPRQLNNADFETFRFSKNKNGVNCFVNKTDFDKEGVHLTINSFPYELEWVFNKIYKRQILKENQIGFSSILNKAELLFNLKVMSKAKNYKSVTTNALNHTINNKVISDNEQISQDKALFNHLKVLEDTSSDLIKNYVKKYKDTLRSSIYYSNIDYVMPYVTSDDSEWRKLYREYLGDNTDAWATGVERFRDSGMLKYVFRSIDTHMPWIRNLCMIVMSESQIPSWVNKDNIKIITHDMFIPEKFRPVFNSSTLEMFLSEIPFVSDCFIYSNDDLITFKDLDPDYFFINGVTPSYQITFRNYKRIPGDFVRKNSYNLIMNEDQNKRVVTTQHGTMSYRIGTLKECYKKYKNKMWDSCTRFREDKNLNQYLYALYQVLYKSVDIDKKDIVSYVINPTQINKILKDDFTKRDFICLNDSNDSTPEIWKKVLDKLEKLLPNKSKYEL